MGANDGVETSSCRRDHRPGSTTSGLDDPKKREGHDVGHRQRKAAADKGQSGVHEELKAVAEAGQRDQAFSETVPGRTEFERVEEKGTGRRIAALETAKRTAQAGPAATTSRTKTKPRSN